MARGRALRRQEYDDSLDKLTGLPADVAFDASQGFNVDTVVNHAHAAQQFHEREIRKDAEKLNGGKAPEGWNDGHRYVVRTLTPDELAKDGRGN